MTRSKCSSVDTVGAVYLSLKAWSTTYFNVGRRTFSDVVSYTISSNDESKIDITVRPSKSSSSDYPDLSVSGVTGCAKLGATVVDKCLSDLGVEIKCQNWWDPCPVFALVTLDTAVVGPCNPAAPTTTEMTITQATGCITDTGYVCTSGPGSSPPGYCEEKANSSNCINDHCLCYDGYCAPSKFAACKKTQTVSVSFINGQMTLIVNGQLITTPPPRTTTTVTATTSTGTTFTMTTTSLSTMSTSTLANGSDAGGIIGAVVGIIAGLLVIGGSVAVAVWCCCFRSTTKVAPQVVQAGQVEVVQATPVGNGDKLRQAAASPA